MNEIEKRIRQLEKKVADLEEKIQSQPGLNEIVVNVENKISERIEAVNEKAFHIPKE